MANSTLRGALAIHGGNPQYLIEKVIRARIYDSLFWKEQCFALTGQLSASPVTELLSQALGGKKSKLTLYLIAESIIDKAIELKAIGGVHDRQIPTSFICLTLKLLQLQPEKEILFEYLLAEEFKYLRALSAFYIRLTFRSMEIYEILEPLMRDFRKLRVHHAGGYSLTYFDEFIDDLLTKDRVCDIILPRLTQRAVLEETEGLPPRRSLLEEVVKEEAGSQTSERMANRPRLASRTPSRTPPSSPDIGRDRAGSLSDSDSDGGRYISRSPSRSGSEVGEEGDLRARYISRSPSISPDRQLIAEVESGERIEGDV